MSRLVLIEVTGGVADCTQSPDDVDVIIQDHDNIQDGDPDPLAEYKQEEKANVNGSDEDFDRFLDDSTHALKSIWESRQGRELTMEDDLYALNDVLTAFFSDRRAPLDK